MDEVFTRSKMIWADEIEVDGNTYSKEIICQRLLPMVTEERRIKLHQVVDERDLGIVTLLEQVHDLGNISAVMRTVEAFGYPRLQLLESGNHKYKPANRVTKGTDKWLDLKRHRDFGPCFKELKDQGLRICISAFEGATSIEKVDWNIDSVVVFGNERDGVTSDMLKSADLKFKIPMYGFAQSFNISVAAAMTMHHIKLNRTQPSISEGQKTSLMANYLLRCFDQPGRLLRNL